MEEFLSIENLTNCLAIRAVFHIKEVAELIKESKTEQKVWINELFATDIEKMTRAHLILSMFVSSVRVIAGHSFKDKNIMQVLDLVNKIFAVKHI